MAKFIVTGDQHFDITGQMLEIQRQISQKGGSPIDPKLVTQNLQNIIEGNMKKNSRFLKLYSGFGPLTIVKCEGKRTFLNTTHVFKAIDWGGISESEFADISEETEGSPIQVFESAVLETSYAQAFSFFSFDLSQICFSQDQMLSFYESYGLRSELIGGIMIISLLRCKNQMYIFQVCKGSDGFYAWIKRFNFEQLPIDYTCRLIVPEKIK